ncbi:MAG: glycoside hydrolase family 28 protein [Candidatus Hydrogenedentes bacterium]|nr:glycoside hydrolase family 28 protein [Candidatus Hydrogenedentota bacterium]
MNPARFTALLGLLCLSMPGFAAGVAGRYEVGDYGAVADGATLCTEAVQKAIDDCSANGGGTVRFGAGTYVSGTLVLKTGVTLNLPAGCILAGSENLDDYPVKVPEFRSYTDNYTDKSLIYAEKAERIGISGEGALDGRGRAFEGEYKKRPYMIRFIECREVTVTGVTLRDSPMWVQHYLACDRVRIHGITVRSHVNKNNDGIDIDCCSNVVISDCDIASGDDAIVLKSTADRPCKNITVTNCIVSSLCNGLKMGTESNGGFENIAISNCVVHDTRLSGLALEMVDGGVMDRVVVSNISMSGVGAPIFVRLGNRARPFQKDGKKPGIGVMRNITITNIEARGADMTGCAVSGIPEKRIENLTLSNIRLSFPGGGKRTDATRAISELPDKYPEHLMFGVLPAYGFFCRHVDGLNLDNVTVQLEGEDERHALVLDDVENAVIEGFDAPANGGIIPAMRLVGARNIFVRGCRPRAGTGVFLGVHGKQSAGIVLSGNDFSGVDRVFTTGAGAVAAAVSQTGNIP